MLFLCTVFLGCVFFNNQNQLAGALNSAGLNSATKVANGADLVDSSGSFDDNVLSDLIAKAFKVSGDPLDYFQEEAVQYIQTNGAEDYNTYGVKSPVADSALKATPYYVVPATKINENVGNANYGLVVTLGGQTWMVTSLTLADTNIGNDQVIATLMLADDLKENNEVVTTKFYTEVAGKQGENMYSSSTLRKTLLESESLSMFIEGDFAEEFLVQPKYVTYQQTETVWNGRGGFGYNILNDALGNLTSGWLGCSYTPDFTYQGAMPEPVRYDAWGDDYIWMPSGTEVGYSNMMPSTCIWKLTNDQRCHTYTYSWTRSGRCDHYNYAYPIASNSSFTDAFLTQTYALRPAIHLNLSAAVTPSLKAPTTVTTEYNGSNQDLSTLVTKPNWYKTDIYSDASRVQVTYSTAAMKDVGTYSVTVKILDPELPWKDATSETDVTRTFDFVIVPKKLTVTVTDTNKDGIPNEVTYDPTQICAGDSAPNFRVVYGPSMSGTNWSTSPSTTAGTYYAKAEMTDSNSNYEINTSGTSYYAEFIVKAGVIQPYFASGGEGAYTDSGQYQGGTSSPLFFPLYGVTTNVKITTNTTGMLYDDTNNRLSVTGGVGTYTATVALVSPTTHEWQSGGSDSYTLTITVTKGDYDFSEITWQYKNASGVWIDYPADGIPYTGSTVSLRVSNLPSGLSVMSTDYDFNYNGNHSAPKNAGSYTAKVIGVTGVDTTNYNSVNASAIEQFTLSYKINKVQVPLNWSTTTDKVDGTTVTLPTLSRNDSYPLDLFSVVYYAESDFDSATGAPKAGATALTFSDLRYDETAVNRYYAYALLDDDPTYAANYELTGDKYKTFTLGAGKTAVLVTLTNDTKVYDGNPYEAVATCQYTDGASVKLDLQYTYYSDAACSAKINAPINAGNYYVKVEVGSRNSDEFAVSGESVFPFTIQKADYDLSQLSWEIGDLTFALSDSITLEFNAQTNTLQLVGWENVGKDFYVTLGGDVSERNVGLYTVTLSIDEDSANYNPCGLSTTVRWEITVRDFDKPVNSGEWMTYDAEEHDLSEILGMEEGWEDYLDITVVYTSPSGQTTTYTNEYVFSDAGSYKVTFSAKSGMNVNGIMNVRVGGDVESDPITVTVDAIKLTVTGWSGSKSAATAITNIKIALDYVYTDDKGNEVDYSVIAAKTPGSYRKQIKTSENYTLSYASGVPHYVAFSINEQGEEIAEEVTPPEITYLEIPTFAGGMIFTGEAFNVAEYLNGFDSAYMTFTVEGDAEVLKAGEYTVIIALKDPDTTRWIIGSVAQNVSVVKLTVTVPLAETENDWDDQPVDVAVDPLVIPISNWNAVAGKVPELTGVSESVIACLDFTYTTEDGKAIDPSKLEVGTNYIVTATVKDEFVGSVYFEDDAGQRGISSAFEFTFTKASSWLDFFTQKYLGIALWLWLLIALAVLLFLIFIIVLAKRRKEKKKEENTAAQGAGAQGGMGGYGMPMGMPIGMGGIMPVGVQQPVVVGSASSDQLSDIKQELRDLRQDMKNQPAQSAASESSTEQFSELKNDLKQEFRDLREDLKSQPAQQPVVAQPAQAVVQPVVAQPVQPKVVVQQPVAAQPTQPIIINGAPAAQPVQPQIVIQGQSAQPQNVKQEQPARASESVSADHLKDEIKNELKDDFGHKERVERLLETIAISREQDRLKIAQEDQERSERMHEIEVRRKERMEAMEFHHAPYDPSTERIRELEGKLHSMEEMMWMMRFGGMQQAQQPQQAQIVSAKDDRVQQLENELRDMKAKQEADSRREMEEKLKDMERRQELREMELMRQLDEERRRNDEDRRLRELEERMNMRYGYYPPQVPSPAVQTDPMPKTTGEKEQPVVVVQQPIQQPSNQTPQTPHTVQPGSVMTTTTTTTIDATKDAKTNESPDYSSRFTSRRR